MYSLTLSGHGQSVRPLAHTRKATNQPVKGFAHLHQRQTRQHQHVRTVVCHGVFGIGLPELVVMVGVAALLFGPNNLPELGRSLGKTAKSFRDAAKEFESELKAASEDTSSSDGSQPVADNTAVSSKE